MLKITPIVENTKKISRIYKERLFKGPSSVVCEDEATSKSLLITVQQS